MGRSRTFLLMAAMTALFVFIGSLIGGQQGMMFALIFAIGTNFFSYWFSDKIVLKMYGARPVDPTEDPRLFSMVETLAKGAEIPTPRLYIMDNPQPNAFATGRNPEHGVVALTTGIMETLSTQELAGVIAHEMAHIKNRDTLTMTVTASIAGAISALANMAIFMGGRRDENGNGGRSALVGLLAMFLAPLAASLVQMAISRTREFEADRVGAQICSDPLALASALEKISGKAQKVDNLQAESNPATAHMFIINPLHLGSLSGLFRTHPDTSDRIQRLEIQADIMKKMEAGVYAPGVDNRMVEVKPRAVPESGPWSVEQISGKHSNNNDPKIEDNKSANPWG